MTTAPGTPPRMSSATIGGLYLCVAMLLAAGIDVAVKLLTTDFATPQIVLLRTALSFPFLLAICWQRRALPGLLKPRWGWQLYRGLLATGANFGFFYALAYLDLVTAVLLAYIAPVLIVLAARPILGEAVGFARWLGIGTAFVGVLVVLQPAVLHPNSGGLHPAALAVLFSALCWALLSITNRQLGSTIDAGVLAFYTAPLSALFGWLLMEDWVAPTLLQWCLFGFAALCGATAHFFTALAYRHAEAATIAPLEYTNLIWSAAAGWLLWNALPGPWVWAGGALILVGGYFSLTATGDKTATG